MELYNIQSLSIGSLDKNTAEGQNGLRALENAMCHYNDDRKIAFSIIEVEGYKCIAHIKCVGTDDRDAVRNRDGSQLIAQRKRPRVDGHHGATVNSGRDNHLR